MPAKYKKPKPVEASTAAGIPPAKAAHTSTRKTLKRGMHDEASTGKQETSILEALGLQVTIKDPAEEEDLAVSKKPRKTPIGSSSAKDPAGNSIHNKKTSDQIEGVSGLNTYQYYNYRTQQI